MLEANSNTPIADAVATAIEKTTDLIRRGPSPDASTRERWRSLAPGSFQTENYTYLDWSKAIGYAREHLNEQTWLEEFRGRLRSELPVLVESFVGLPYMGRHWDLAGWLIAAGATVLQRQGQCSAQDVARDIMAVILQKRVAAVHRTPLVGFHLDGDVDGPIELSPRMVLRQLSDVELTEIYGGDRQWPQLHLGLRGDMTRWILEETVEVPVNFRLPGEVSPNGPPGEEVDAHNYAVQVREWLLTFKKGSLGTEDVVITTRSLAPHVGCRIVQGRLARPRGWGYKLSVGELGDFKAHVSRLRMPVFPQLALACRRLVDAEGRYNPVDALTDAAIGLEPLLVDSKEEVSLRFRMNYSGLVRPTGNEAEDAKLRRQRYSAARDLYSHRSTIMHSGTLPAKKLRIGDRVELTHDDAAEIAKQMLRETIKWYLGESRFSGRENLDKRELECYWEEGYFGER